MTQPDDANSDAAADGTPSGDADDTTSYAPWTEQDARRARNEAEIVENIEVIEILDPTGTANPAEHRDIVEDLVINTNDSNSTNTGANREDVPPEDIYIVYDARGRTHSTRTYGARPPGAKPGATGPGVSGVFGPGTPLGEATGLRLKPRKRWLALLAGVVGGMIGAQSFYTGRIFRGMFQFGLTLSSWLLALITFGLMEPFAEVVTVVVWLWGAVEGVRYLTARQGPYATDALGGLLE